jgi:hypothetical protein
MRQNQPSSISSANGWQDMADHLEKRLCIIEQMLGGLRHDFDERRG